MSALILQQSVSCRLLSLLDVIGDFYSCFRPHRCAGNCQVIGDRGNDVKSAASVGLAETNDRIDQTLRTKSSLLDRVLESSY